LTWSAAVTSAFSASQITNKKVFICYVLTSISVNFWVRRSKIESFECSETTLLSKENTLFACAAALLIYFATYPNLLPSWGNVDFAQHAAMVESLKLSLLDSSPHSITFGDWQKSYPYLFGFHFINATLIALTNVEPLRVLHGSISLIYGLLILAVLELSEVKSRLVKLAIVCVSFFILPLHVFIRLGWAPHFWATAITLLGFVFLQNLDAVRKANTTLHTLLTLGLLWLCSAAYPFCGIAFGLGLIWATINNTKVSLKALALLGISCFLVLLPLIAQPILLDTITVSFEKLFLARKGEYYHALRVGVSEPLVSPLQWLLFAVLGCIALIERSSARTIALVVIYHALLNRFFYTPLKYFHC
jgi:hypothetical protein